MPSYRVIRSGHVIEIYKYQSSIQRKLDDDFRCDRGGRDNEGKEERKKEYNATVNQRARNTIRRLINANFTSESLFITLTYKKNMQDIESANNDLKKFVQKMKRRQSDFKYVAVIEFQKRGAIHYHMLCNYLLDWKTNEERQNHELELGKIWAHGFVDIGYKKNDNAGAYLIKYMTKDNDDERLKGKKRYFFSRSLNQPEELIGADAIEVIKTYESLPPVFTNEYFSDFHGTVNYYEYNPLRYDYTQFINSVDKYEMECVDKAIELFGEVVTVI